MLAALPTLLSRFAGPKQRRRSLFETARGESLETRVLPAAVASVSKATLNITGDADASDLQIEQVVGGVKVSALNGTTIRVGGADVAEFTFAGVTGLNVRLGEGDDSVAVLGSLNLKNVSFELGDGDNVVSVGAGMNISGKLTIKGGTGNDQITLNSTIGKSASLTTGLGNDEIFLRGTAFSSTVSINTGVGADTVDIDETLGGLDASFNNTLSITTGEDNDNVSIKNTTTKRVSVNTGDDDDIVTLDTVTANGTLSVQTGAGADELNLLAVTETLNGTNTFNVGTGADAVVIARSSFQGTVNFDLGTGIFNTLSIDDTSFLAFFNLNANGTGDVIDIETNTSLVGDTVFSKAAKVKVGANADINLGVVNAASDTRFLSTVSVSGINPAAELTVAVLNTSFVSQPSLVKVNRFNI